MVMAVIMGMRVVMRVGMIMLMVVGMIMVVLVRVIMTLCTHGGPYAVVVVMDISLIVVVNDQGARGALLMGMMMIVLMAMFMVVLMIVFMVVIIFMAGDPRLAASAYATHINLPRCR
ncbi:hypothetical protein [Aeromonas sobria]|uniref:hypothetical protein n=1 Tax=Aeromonas sobria TaxID=646 RepID=UPI001F4FBDE6|nr:hypothetical protein [Aeromonas sobria]